jgi:prepilin-type N-terminal cleavage/methylation domain-containing protein
MGVNNPFHMVTFLSRRHRSGFTLIEILIVLSIVATLSIVAYASTQAIQTSRYNTKRVADVAALTNALEAQYLQTKVVPDPTANRQYFDNHGGYMHSASGAYGVTSLFSEDILSKSSLAYHPRDPDTDSYYAYGKLLQYAPEYQVGAVLRVDGTPTAYIR